MPIYLQKTQNPWEALLPAMVGQIGSAVLLDRILAPIQHQRDLEVAAQKRAMDIQLGKMARVEKLKDEGAVETSLPYGEGEFGLLKTPEGVRVRQIGDRTLLLPQKPKTPEQILSDKGIFKIGDQAYRLGDKGGSPTLTAITAPKTETEKDDRTSLQKEFDRFKENNPTWEGNIVDFETMRTLRKVDPRKAALSAAGKDYRVIFGKASLGDVAQEYFDVWGKLGKTETPTPTPSPTPTYSHTAVNEQGQRIGWDGTKWVPIE